MDTSDPEITFDSEGECNHCKHFEEETSKSWYPDEVGLRMLVVELDKVRRAGKGKEYDCIIGLSGGVDSSYLALKLKEYALRPLVVHVDAGWNSELAVYNIEQIVKYCGYELFTHVMDWEEIRDLQVSFLKAGVANQDVVQDHAFFATLYHFAVKNKIRYVISGGNIATESVFPMAWHHSAMDALSIRAIHKKFGSAPLRNYKTISFFEYYLYYPVIKKMRTIRPLNYMPYNKADALQDLKNTIGYKEYGRKHGESIFTKFFQNYYLPQKFGYDKRRPHLSSQILSGEITRAQALTELEKELYSAEELETDKDYVAKKLGLSIHELHGLIEGEGNHYTKFKNWDGRYNRLKQCQRFTERITGKSLSNYA